MNICILSMQAVDNYGSVLQAYALKKILNDLGHKVDFIEIEYGENKVLNKLCVVKNEIPVQKTGYDVKNIINEIMIKIEGKLFRIRLHMIMQEFRQKQLARECSSVTDRYDICVIGSDEVFNCMQESKWGFSPQLYGNVKCAEKIITYAASCGSTSYETLPEQIREAVIKPMQNLAAISVRDENTANFVRSIVDTNIVYNLDPVAVWDFSGELRNYNIKRILKMLPKRYCVVYSYNGRMDNGKLKEEVCSYCEKHGLTPIAPFGKQKWIKNRKQLKPFELLIAFQYAECVITDTFHGTIFAAKFSKRLAVFIQQSNHNKLSDLVERIGINNHVVQAPEMLEKILDIELDRMRIDNLLNREFMKSKDYLYQELSIT